MYYAPGFRWRAVYQTEKGTGYDIDKTEIDECPVSHISPWAAEVVASLALNTQVRDATGESPLPSVKLWPAKFVDAARICEVERIKEHNARIEAEASEREG